MTLRISSADDSGAERGFSINEGNSRSREPHPGWNWVAWLFLATFTSAAITDNRFDPIQWNQGRALYQQGIRIAPEADANIVAIGETLAPLRLFTCAQCHGDRAQGLQESGIRAPALTWQQLSKPYPVASGQHRRRAPYNRETFVQALSLGIDPSGNELTPPMPRYHLEWAEVYDRAHGCSRRRVIGA